MKPNIENLYNDYLDLLNTSSYSGHPSKEKFWEYLEAAGIYKIEKVQHPYEMEATYRIHNNGFIDEVHESKYAKYLQKQMDKMKTKPNPAHYNKSYQEYLSLLDSCHIDYKVEPAQDESMKLQKQIEKLANFSLKSPIQYNPYEPTKNKDYWVQQLEDAVAESNAKKKSYPHIPMPQPTVVKMNYQPEPDPKPEPPKEDNITSISAFATLPRKFSVNE